MKHTLTLTKKLRRDEGGWVLVTAIMLLFIMLVAALAAVDLVDNQTKQSGKNRERETSFNVAESALNNQVYLLSVNPPEGGQTQNVYGQCIQSTGTASCPSNATINNLFPTADLGTGSCAPPACQWSTQVFDNPSSNPNYYSDAAVSGQPGYDANGDHKVWVRASATIRGHTRTVIALVREELEPEPTFQSGLLAGSVSFSNNGNKVFVLNDGATGKVTVRCDPNSDPSFTCLGYSETTNGQCGKSITAWTGCLNSSISPQSGYAWDPNMGPAMTAESLSRLEDRAKADGRYYTGGCPSDSQIYDPTKPSRQVVVLDIHTSCSYQGNTNIFSNAQPGILILLNSDSSIEFKGTSNLYGVVYDPNLPLPGTAGTKVMLHGTGCVYGGVMVDGPGNVDVGSSGKCDGGQGNIEFVASNFGGAQSYANAGIIQNSWRETTAGG